MVNISHCTTNEAPQSQKRYWEKIVTETYFPLSLHFKDSPSFSGALNSWDLGLISLSKLESDALLYQRNSQHLEQAEAEESYLVTIPDNDSIDFSQNGRDVGCSPGGFILQRSHLPYQFSYTQPNRLWVLKIPAPLLRSRVGMPERLVSLAFDASQGAGELMTEMVRMVAVRLDQMDQAARQTIGSHLTDLLALAVLDHSPMQSGLTSVQTAHLYRAEKYIRDHIQQPLRPQDIASACGISLRYLHMLFQMRGQSVSSWVQEQRLLFSDTALQQHAHTKSIAQIAYEWGFSSPAAFSQLYKNHFGQSPSEARSQYRARLNQHNDHHFLVDG